MRGKQLDGSYNAGNNYVQHHILSFTSLNKMYIILIANKNNLIKTSKINSEITFPYIYTFQKYNKGPIILN